MKDGFVKIALASPKIRLADTDYNATECIRAAKEACENGASVIAFPELTLTGATCADLFFSDELISGAERALTRFIEETAELDAIIFIGLPVRVDEFLYDCVAAVAKGEVIALSPAYNPSPELSRYFVSAKGAEKKLTVLEKFGSEFVFGAQYIYKSADADSHLRIFVEVGADADAVLPISFEAAKNGANLIINPFAKPEYLGAARKRRIDTQATSDRLSAVYARVGAGVGESGTDGAYAAPRLIASMGEMLCESEAFSSDTVYATVDLAACDSERRMRPQFIASDSEFITPTFFIGEREVEIDAPEKSPFIPECECERDKACALAIEIASYALSERMKRAYAKSAVIGVSGGLDSTLAVLVAARAADILGVSREKIIAITMPCFGTSKRTKGNALLLARELGCSVRTIDIKAAVERHFKDIGHEKDNYNVVYENAQARERTQILMDVANAEGGIVIGTGDLSELALGFATYNGDHMSMYGVNASVPKTLMRAIVRYAAKSAKADGNAKLAAVLNDVVDTPVSPELLPISGEENAQYTESIVGPYELHDFFLYYAVKYGFTKKKIKRLAVAAFGDEYSADDISKYLDIFFRRFMTQQFKRSCMPDGPRVSEISLSPRGAWRMPSDASAELWKK